jgi:Fe-S cluster assembly protein SufB
MSDEILDEVTASEYKYGFVTDIESDTVAPGLNEDVIRMISAKKNEPSWMLEWRLDAFKIWLDMKEPEWSNVTYKKPDFQAISYYSAPKQKKTLDSLDEVDPELLKTFEKLGISLNEQVEVTKVILRLINFLLRIRLESQLQTSTHLLPPPVLIRHSY